MYNQQYNQQQQNQQQQQQQYYNQQQQQFYNQQQQQQYNQQQFYNQQQQQQYNQQQQFQNNQQPQHQQYNQQQNAQPNNELYNQMMQRQQYNQQMMYQQNMMHQQNPNMTYGNPQQQQFYYQQQQQPQSTLFDNFLPQQQQQQQQPQQPQQPQQKSKQDQLLQYFPELAVNTSKNIEQTQDGVLLPKPSNITTGVSKGGVPNYDILRDMIDSDLSPAHQQQPTDQIQATKSPSSVDQNQMMSGGSGSGSVSKQQQYGGFSSPNFPQQQQQQQQPGSQGRSPLPQMQGDQSSFNAMLQQQQFQHQHPNQFNPQQQQFQNQQQFGTTPPHIQNLGQNRQGFPSSDSTFNSMLQQQNQFNPQQNMFGSFNAPNAVPSNNSDFDEFGGFESSVPQNSFQSFDNFNNSGNISNQQPFSNMSASNSVGKGESGSSITKPTITIPIPLTNLSTPPAAPSPAPSVSSSSLTVGGSGSVTNNNNNNNNSNSNSQVKNEDDGKIDLDKMMQETYRLAGIKMDQVQPPANTTTRGATGIWANADKYKQIFDNVEKEIDFFSVPDATTTVSAAPIVQTNTNLTANLMSNDFQTTTVAPSSFISKPIATSDTSTTNDEFGDFEDSSFTNFESAAVNTSTSTNTTQSFTSQNNQFGTFASTNITTSPVVQENNVKENVLNLSNQFKKATADVFQENKSYNSVKPDMFADKLSPLMTQLNTQELVPNPIPASTPPVALSSPIGSKSSTPTIPLPQVKSPSTITIPLPKSASSTPPPIRAPPSNSSATSSPANTRKTTNLFDDEFFTTTTTTSNPPPTSNSNTFGAFDILLPTTSSTTPSGSMDKSILQPSATKTSTEQTIVDTDKTTAAATTSFNDGEDEFEGFTDFKSSELDIAPSITPISNIPPILTPISTTTTTPIKTQTSFESFDDFLKPTPSISTKPISTTLTPSTTVSNTTTAPKKSSDFDFSDFDVFTPSTKSDSNVVLSDELLMPTSSTSGNKTQNISTIASIPTQNQSLLLDILSSLVSQERLEEAIDCQNQVKLYEGSKKELDQEIQNKIVQWTDAPPANHQTIVQMKQSLRVKNIPNDTIDTFFSQFDHQPLSSMANTDLTVAYELQQKTKALVQSILSGNELKKSGKKINIEITGTALQHCLDELEQSLEVLSMIKIQDAKVKPQILQSQKYRDYLQSLSLIYSISYNITKTLQESSHPLLNELSNTIGSTWKQIIPYFNEIKFQYFTPAANTININQKSVLSSSKSTISNCHICGCILDSSVDNVTQSNNHNHFHMKCANFWVNVVDINLP